MLGGLTVTSVVGIVRSVAFYSYKGTSKTSFNARSRDQMTCAAFNNGHDS